MRPVVVGFEAEAVEMVGDVQAGAGRCVLPPCSAGARVLLADAERYVGLLEADAGQDAGFAAPDDQDRNLGRAFGRQWGRAPRVGTVEGELLGDQREGGGGE